jgi:D-serine deaminase-like pyridoxal phosphate-dependent protein
MKLEQLETPALVADQKVFEENLKAMEELLKGSTLRLLPHYKSNK